MPNDNPIYLDHNATTPVAPEVVDAMLPLFREGFGNPSSGHVYGQRARRALERARAQVAALLGCEPDEILFTSGGTEANNLAIRGATEARLERRHLVTSAVEHPATLEPCRELGRRGFRLDVAPVGADGRVSVEVVASVLSDETSLVTLMHANNETGVVQPVRGVADAAKKRGALVHTDAAQSVGKLRVDVNELGVDLLSVAGHKVQAPKGVGALFVRRGTSLRPFMLGAGHERGLRPGTENVALAVGLGVACELARRALGERTEHMRALADRLWGRLVESVPCVALNGYPAPRLPNTLNVRFPGVSGSALLAAAPEVAASTGSACHAGSERPSAVVLAMGVPPDEALGTVRLSVGPTTSEGEVDRAAAALVRAWRSLRGEAS
ncbi:MAG: cysteine desulfurase [Polyangiaceae bacterium]|jgi:cysteine desulfurase|nr:cysteine desulfurase [Polyangiaceae bacterium]